MSDNISIKILDTRYSYNTTYTYGWPVRQRILQITDETGKVKTIIKSFMTKPVGTGHDFPNAR